MREVNFSIPNANKASVGITTALYDRRALDCTATLPLINSLNHLAYLTSSSLRIRDILVVDGGLQRLVAILKQGRSSRDIMCMWKWNLAFQCIINLGVRGTEVVRTRVVEADLVPVLITILDNYNRIVDKCRQKANEARMRHANAHAHARALNAHTQTRGHHAQSRSHSHAHSHSHSHSHTHSHHFHPHSLSQMRLIPLPPPILLPVSSSSSSDGPSTSALVLPSPLEHTGSSTFTMRSSRQDGDIRRHRRQRPPPLIDVSAATTHPIAATAASTPSAASSTTADVLSLVSTPSHQPPHSPPERSSFVSLVSMQAATAAIDVATATSSSRSCHGQQTAAELSVAPSEQVLADQDALSRPLHNIDRLGVITPFGHPDLASLPNSPTTPLPPPVSRHGHPARNSQSIGFADSNSSSSRSRRRPSVRHQHSTAEPTDFIDDSMHSDEALDAEIDVDPSGIETIGFDDPAGSAVGIQDITMEDADVMLTGASLGIDIPTASETQEAVTFNINHPGGPVDAIGIPGAPTIGLPANRPSMVAPPPLPTANTTIPHFLVDRYYVPPPEIVAVLPREEDILMTIQLLAYISKYYQLREYFLYTHLVPKLRVIKELKLIDGTITSIPSEPDAENLFEEYLQPDDVNMFPIVEKFTFRSHSPDMQYWAGVVMRNFCRKDESRGGVRQCANYQCGRWEEYSRQFAKCRRCRRTKYCSKDCQKAAWFFHRHWCHAAQ